MMLEGLTVERARGLRETVFAYIRLTKPRIIELLLVTTVPAMILAERGWPSTWLVLATLIGGTLSAGGANALNCYFDRDIDAVMARTKSRPLPSGQIEPEKAAIFGLILGGVGFLFLQAFVNLLAAGLTLGALAFYVFVYTLILKRTTPLNIVIGGAAGAIPPMVGWVAVTGEIQAPALVLFLLVVVWTPPHFWALSLNLAADYERAGVPMLPVVAGKRETEFQILLHTIAVVAVSFLLFVSDEIGVIYLVAALALGCVFIYYAYRLWLDSTVKSAAMLFRYSIAYLALLFGAVALDGLL